MSVRWVVGIAQPPNFLQLSHPIIGQFDTGQFGTRQIDTG